MGTNLYFLSDGKAYTMNEHLYDKEDNLQELIADNPQLLLRPSDGDNSLMLVAREYPVIDPEDGSSFSLDHLFLDKNGVPVLVEVKRSTDTRIRREVIGQMMDYASRARIWSIADICENFKANNPGNPLIDDGDFWQRVSTNLKAEKLRLVFAADKIPAQLKTLISFMNRSMRDIDIYGVEIRQYKSDGATLLTSDVIEDTIEKERSTAPQSIAWNADNMAVYLEENGIGDFSRIFNDLYDYAVSVGLNCYYGRGSKYPSILVKRGKTSVFKMNPWKNNGELRCMLEMCMVDLATAAQMPETDVRTLMTNLPNRANWYDSRLIWDTPQYIFFDMTIFKDEATLSAFKDSLRELIDKLR